jgi:hypothetical protein
VPNLLTGGKGADQRRLGGVKLERNASVQLQKRWADLFHGAWPGPGRVHMGRGVVCLRKQRDVASSTVLSGVSSVACACSSAVVVVVV